MISPNSRRTNLCLLRNPTPKWSLAGPLGEVIQLAEDFLDLLIREERGRSELEPGKLALYDITEVSMSIYQPRRENVSTWTISVDELNAWAENVLKPNAELAHKGEGDYLPGPWCQFCKAAVKPR